MFTDAAREAAPKEVLDPNFPAKGKALGRDSFQAEARLYSTGIWVSITVNVLGFNRTVGGFIIRFY